MTDEPSDELLPAVRTALVARLTAMADDELVLGHRNSEWTGHAPMLEEDIALANLAQDEIGHAVLWYELVSALDGSDSDRLVFHRDPSEFRNCRLVALPRGDWAFTMLRQFLFDAYEAELLPRLERSAWRPLAESAAKARREELFHLRHSGMWLERLALGTNESRRRLAAAIDLATPELPGLLAALPGDELLAEEGHFPHQAELAAAVLERVAKSFEAVGLPSSGLTTDSQTTDSLPTDSLPGTEVTAARTGSSGQTTTSGRHAQGPELMELVSTMQSVARADVEAPSW